MKIPARIWFLALFCSLPAAAQLRVNPAGLPSVFCGAGREIPVSFINSADHRFSGEIRTRIFQATATTGMLVSQAPWKKLEVPAQATILETAALDFPAVKAGQKFLVQWLAGTNVLGLTTVLVYPTNLLQMFPVQDRARLGVFDPDNQLKPLLRAQKIPYTDLAEMELDHFTGDLAVIGPFKNRSEMPDGLASRIDAIARKSVAVVWIRPPEERPANPQPSFYAVEKGRTAVIVAQPEIVAGLAENPGSQLDLIYLCQLAMNPQPAVLPDLFPQP